MIFDLLAAGLLLADSKNFNIKVLPSIQISQTINSSKTASKMDYLNNELDRAELLYSNLMFEEGDRVADMAIMRINAFLDRHRDRKGINEIEAVYQSRVNQLKTLKEYKQHDREIILEKGQENYNSKKQERERKAKEDREYLYKLAVEARRTAEARAQYWWRTWCGRPYKQIIIYN